MKTLVCCISSLVGVKTKTIGASRGRTNSGAKQCWMRGRANAVVFPDHVSTHPNKSQLKRATRRAYA